MQGYSVSSQPRRTQKQYPNAPVKNANTGSTWRSGRKIVSPQSSKGNEQQGHRDCNQESVYRNVFRRATGTEHLKKSDARASLRESEACQKMFRSSVPGCTAFHRRDIELTALRLAGAKGVE